MNHTTAFHEDADRNKPLRRATDQVQTGLAVPGTGIAALTRYELVEHQHGGSKHFFFDKSMDVDPVGTFCKFEEAKALVDGRPGATPAPIQSAELAELRRLAEAVKDSGEWESTDRTVYALEHHGWRKGEELFRNRFSFNVQRGSGFDDKACAMVANFCAAANPAAILRLLDALAAVPTIPAQPIADVSAPKVEKVKQIAYFRKASEFGPWIECELSDPNGMRFTSMEDRPLGAGAADVSAPTDLSRRLRSKAVTPFGPEDFALLRQAADEIDRLARAAAPVSGPSDA